ncbi:penicillin-binding protein 1F [Candidatus Phycosocius bacilliformis]|uniref:Penicillin-binding protein 1F n=2 Tax=Candidatus Phycosocius bacilliformis TaxID=1445552 RepID=A0A2P2EAZ2_9PROT|nr:penicillin-binding protein 1F [Candidatus Phycosocius bacilliformis]
MNHGVFRADLMDRRAKLQAYHMRLIIILALSVVTLTGLTSYAIWRHFFSDLPKITSNEEIWTANRKPSLEMVDANGETIAMRGPRYGRKVSVDALPAHVLQAFLAVEDARFFEHGGVDLWSIGRAVVENLTAGHTVQGASTITQQLVKNVYLSPEQTFKRKLQEMVLAWQIDSRLSKKEILEIYLNRIYFGQNAYGLDAAAWHFFSKHPTKLTLAEAAMLAGLPKAPGRLAIDLTAAPAVERRAVVLNRMVEAGFITQAQASLASGEPVVLTIAPDLAEGQLGYAIDMAQKEVDSIGRPIAPDRVLRLTVDQKMQAAAVAAVQELIGAGRGSGVTQAALVAMDRQGRILAIVGGRDYGESKYNRATMAKRQPGSSFKPFVYAAALEKGMSPDTIRVDRPITIGTWRPRNFGGGYAGAMTLSTALTRSVNTVAVQLAAEVGIDRLLLLAQRLGIDSELPRNLSIALGAGEVTLLDMTRAYATLANDGVRVDPYLIERIDTTRGTVAYQRDKKAPVQVYEPLRARQMTAMLADVVAFGTGKRAKLPGGREAAGKTGTSQNYRDAWFVGYTADIICGVWVGNDGSTPMRGVTGGTLPALIWEDFMAAAHEGKPLSPLPTLEDLKRPSPGALAAFYESLADMFAAAGGQDVAALPAVRKLPSPQPLPTTATP